jgi:hypothetical protein
MWRKSRELDLRRFAFSWFPLVIAGAFAPSMRISKKTLMHYLRWFRFARYVSFAQLVSFCQPHTPFVPAEAGTQALKRLSAWPLGPRFRGDERKMLLGMTNNS